MKDVSPVIVDHAFRERDFVSGHPALDFVNTVTGRNGTPFDWISDPSGLADWAAAAGLLTPPEREGLIRRFNADPEAAAAALHRAKLVREAMYAVLDAATSGGDPRPADVETIGREWRAAAVASRLGWTAEGLDVAVDVDPEVVTNRVLFDFLSLGRQLRSERLRRCAGDNCAWFFLDTSKAGRRRWCDMATCGNAAKYVRAKGG